jgi:hypothetical protein
MLKKIKKLFKENPKTYWRMRKIDDLSWYLEEHERKS